jgi:xyloglucan-specific exo-beta-1,4-glucanase
MNKEQNVYVPYEYKNAPVPGGGFVTGLCFHPKERNILYARTDVGGVYRYDFHTRTWLSLMDHVKATEKWESYPLSIAVDPTHPGGIFTVAGDYIENNYICRSIDFGKNFEYFKVPAKIHGNAPGRGTGERLAIDPHNPNIVYFASLAEGLLISTNRGESFQRLPVIPKGGKEEHNLAFIWLDSRSQVDERCHTIVVSVSGQANSPGATIRGSSLYISRDAGNSFEALPGQPENQSFGSFPGFVGQRAAFSEGYLFITMAATGKPQSGWAGYSCDAGGDEHGCILRYQLSPKGEITEVNYVTPDLSFMGGGCDRVSKIAGFGGIDAMISHSGCLICSTQGSSREEAVLYTTDYGEHWFPVLYDLEIGIMDFQEVPYMKPEYNDHHNLLHWISDIKLDPFNPNRAVFNSGTGIFMTENLTNARKGEEVIFRPCCKGLEETVHMNIYSPPGGEVQLLDMIGDLGGFAFTDLTRPAENSFADENNHRYITCLNADYPDSTPELVAVSARGNWKGKTTGGILWSEDQCKTFIRLPDPVNISERIDRLIKAVRSPNTNPGWTAVSADAGTLVWCIADHFRLPAQAVVVTNDCGQTWTQTRIYDREQHQDTESSGTLKVFSDRIDPEVFYGFGQNSKLYISTDRACSFHQIDVPESFPVLELGNIEREPRTEIRVQSGKQGVIWLAVGKGGLWRLLIHKEGKKVDLERITSEGEEVFCQGMGKAAPGNSFDTLYVSGIIGSDYGFYRSFDEGRTWQRINSDQQMYGDIVSITGDPRCFGRVYIATASRGVLWGDPRASISRNEVEYEIRSKGKQISRNGRRTGDMD